MQNKLRVVAFKVQITAKGLQYHSKMYNVLNLKKKSHKLIKILKIWDHNKSIK